MFHLILSATFILTVLGCGARYNIPEPSSTTDKQTVAGGGQRFAVQPATSVECAAGGSVYSIYDDSNGNSSLDVEETVLNRQIVCNGTSGQNGFSTLFSLDRVSTGFLACASGSGLQINAGLDTDANSTLEASEITQAQILCDGQNGAVGGAGPAGVSGTGVVFKSVPALPGDCAGGGSILLMALDVGHTGVYSAVYPGQQSVTLCNGVNGTNGANGTNGHDGADAPVAAYSPVDSIMPCGNTVAYKEVLLRLYNGQVLASFSNDTGGTMTRLSFLPDGTFMTTDNSACTFTLATSGDGQTRSISWANQVQMSWSMH